MKTINRTPLAALLALSVLAAPVLAADAVTGTDYEAVVAELRASFSEKGDVKLDRIDQSPMQKACSQAEMAGKPLSQREAAAITKAAMAAVKKPADGNYLGDWKAGEKIAQNGRGLQTSDKPGTPNGGNCYACHQMTKAEISYGNIGPSLLNYGKLRGSSQAMIDYTWSKLYDSHGTMACSTMPRFGAAGILTEAQLKDVMALLLDPQSHVNND